MSLHRTIRRLRNELGLLQEEVAMRAGISPAYLSQIENGKRAPTPGVLSRVAEALGTTAPVLYVLTLEVDDVPPSRREAFKELAPAIFDFFTEAVVHTQNPRTHDEIKSN